MCAMHAALIENYEHMVHENLRVGIEKVTISGRIIKIIFHDTIGMNESEESGVGFKVKFMFLNNGNQF